MAGAIAVFQQLEARAEPTATLVSPALAAALGSCIRNPRARSLQAVVCGSPCGQAVASQGVGLGARDLVIVGLSFEVHESLQHSLYAVSNLVEVALGNVLLEVEC